MKMKNKTDPLTSFLLMGLTFDPALQLFLFFMFLFMYAVTLIGNAIIMIVTKTNTQLGTPMYFFLRHLAFVDICLSSVTVPKLLANLLASQEISKTIFGTFVGEEPALLTIMAYDRYVAICHPLRYRLIMTWEACIQMAGASWISTLIDAVLHTAFTSRLNFCDQNKIGQFFCDIPQLQKISCSNAKVNQILIFVIGISVAAFCFTLIIISYGYIFSAVMKIPSDQGRYKAFSTCTPHLTVFSLFITTAAFSYMRPKSLSSPTIDLLSAILYTVLPPVLNPIIYSLRNREIQKAIGKILRHAVSIPATIAAGIA
uniref:G-protein coupled receptors family 1 profile domain-containing protein n=1 Tax=Salvator merianae TaxID=96440 RepID=A0A8D0E4Y7_SALMN